MYSFYVEISLNFNSKLSWCFSQSLANIPCLLINQDKRRLQQEHLLIITAVIWGGGHNETLNLKWTRLRRVWGFYGMFYRGLTNLAWVGGDAIQGALLWRSHCAHHQALLYFEADKNALQKRGRCFCISLCCNAPLNLSWLIWNRKKRFTCFKMQALHSDN